jgi:hypothetical protein
MNCAEAMERASEALDGALPGEALAAMRAHLDACAGCRERGEQLSALRGLLRGLEEESGSPADRAGLARILAGTSSTRNKEAETRAAAVVIGAVAILTLSAWGLVSWIKERTVPYRTSPPSSPAPVPPVADPRARAEKSPDPPVEKPPPQPVEKPPDPPPPQPPIRFEEGVVDLESTDRSVCEALWDLFKSYPGTVKPADIQEPAPGRFQLRLTYEGDVTEETDRFHSLLDGFSKKYPKTIRSFSMGHQVGDKPAR